MISVTEARKLYWGVSHEDLAAQVEKLIKETAAAKGRQVILTETVVRGLRDYVDKGAPHGPLDAVLEDCRREGFSITKTTSRCYDQRDVIDAHVTISWAL